MEARALWKTVKKVSFLTAYPEKANSKTGHKTINKEIKRDIGLFQGHFAGVTNAEIHSENRQNIECLF